MVAINKSLIWRISKNTGFKEVLIEKDHRLVMLLKDIYRNKFLSKCLILKGGTALNKIFLPLRRLSIDLDFNVLGKTFQEAYNKTFDIFKELKKIAESQDYVFRSKRKGRLSKIKLLYSNLDEQEDFIKVELFYSEHITLLPLQPSKQIRSLTGIQIETKTLRFEELLATKLRALLSRNQGRDLYDVYSASLVKEVDKVLLKRLFLCYCFKEKKTIKPIEEKHSQYVSFSQVIKTFPERVFKETTAGFVEKSINMETIREQILFNFKFLDEFSEEEKLFYLWCRKGQGDHLSKDKLKLLEKHEEALKNVFNFLFPSSKFKLNPLAREKGNDYLTFRLNQN